MVPPMEIPALAALGRDDAHSPVIPERAQRASGISMPEALPTRANLDPAREGTTMTTHHHHDTGYKELFNHPEFVQQLMEGFAPAEMSRLR